MRLEDRRATGRIVPILWRAAVLLMVLTAIAVPLTLYLARGRTLPLRVHVDAKRYVVGAGEPLSITGSAEPQNKRLFHAWSGPGLSTKAKLGRNRLRAPTKPGLYTYSLTVRRSGTRVTDEISVRVLAQRPGSYPLERPQSPRRIPPGLPCAAAPDKRPAKSSFVLRIHGRTCAEGRIVAEVVPAPRGGSGTAAAAGAANSRHLENKPTYVWMGWLGKRLQPGGSRELLLPPAGGSPPTVVALVGDPKLRCHHELQRTIADVNDCSQGDTLGVAGFGWQLKGVGAFLLTAKPPRPPTAAVYRWDLGDGTKKATAVARLLHRFKDKRHFRIVRLTIEAGKHRSTGLRLLVDRTVK